MKKNYVSPHAECMTFRADAAIAACGIRFPGNIFNSGDGRCKSPLDGVYNSENKYPDFFTQDACAVSTVTYCYYTVTDANSTFNS